MNIVSFSFFSLGIFLMSLLSCNSQESNAKLSDKELKSLEIRYKKWVKDTIPKIGTTGEFKKRKIQLTDDSLFLETTDTYDVNINSNFKTKDENITYALDLLDRNNLRPMDSFQLAFVIKNYYEAPMVPQLIYSYGSEIDKYIGLTKDSITDYSFIKGNLTDRNAKARLIMSAPKSKNN